VQKRRVLRAWGGKGGGTNYREFKGAGHLEGEPFTEHKHRGGKRVATHQNLGKQKKDRYGVTESAGKGALSTRSGNAKTSGKR